MPIQSSGRAPYAPGQTVLDVINVYRDRSLQVPFTKEVLTRAGVTESLAARTLQSLELLDLINEKGDPSAALEVLRTAASDEFPARLGEVVRAAYQEVFNFIDPETATAKQVEDAFRYYTPTGQRSRMMTLFIALCEASGIVSEEAKARLTKARMSTAGKSAATRRRMAAKSTTEPPPRLPTTTSPVSGGGRSRPSASDGGAISLPSPLTGLLNTLSSMEAGWTAARRQQFLTTFEVVLDFCIPVVEPGEEKEEEVSP